MDWSKLSAEAREAPVRTCPKCSRDLPATTEFFYQRERGRLRRDCKDCTKARTGRYYATHQDECMERRRQYNETHREQRRERGLAWLADHRDEERARRRAYYAEHRDEAIRRARNWYEANRARAVASAARWQAKHPQQRREYGRRYRQRHASACASHARNRRSRLRGAEGRHTANDVRAQYKRQKGRCYWCGDSVARSGYHVDHVVPLSLGGSNGPENIVIACPPCNLSKHAKHPMEFAGRLC